MKKSAIVFGLASCALGLGFTAFNVYWALGGTRWIDTVFPVSTNAELTTVMPLWVEWLAISLKTAAALFGLATMPFAIRILLRLRLLRLVRFGAWVAACCLTFWGFTQTSFFILLKIKLFNVDYWGDERVIDGHAFLWDPWFLLWGVCLILAMRFSKNYHVSTI
ncbi:MAG: DUF3995 domain-containing protein [Dysgonamonadaceae bacterium]|nr:DUF3995 domain-containing protein [Dysgonamonadaceae bacterium]